MNSHLYVEQEDVVKKWEVRFHELGNASRMFIFTLSQDTFVYPTSQKRIEDTPLPTISESLATVGIVTAETVHLVSSTDEWLETRAGKLPILPNVITPELLIAYTGEERTYKAFAQAAAYTKDGVQILWEQHGVPTPHTHYYHVTEEDVEDMAFEMPYDFQRQYDRYVMNVFDGSGGYGIRFVSNKDIESVLREDFLNKDIQVQGYLDHICSPCVIANITPWETTILAASIQRFSKPGVYGGNIWTRTIPERLEKLEPGFYETNFRALEALRKAGVVGQVNVDSLILSEAVAKKFNLPGTVMREANIRPAGSSVLLRLMNGNVDGEPIDGIRLLSVPVPAKQMKDASYRKILHAYGGKGKARAVLISYNSQSETAGIAIVASAKARPEDFTTPSRE